MQLICHHYIINILFLHFNGHFQGEPGLAGVYWSKGWWRWWWQLDHWSYKSCKAPVKSSPPTNQHPCFLQAGCHSVAPTNSVKAMKGKISHSMDLLTPSLPAGLFQLCLWPLIAPGYIGGGLPCLSSALWCQYPIIIYIIKIKTADAVHAATAIGTSSSCCCCYYYYFQPLFNQPISKRSLKVRLGLLKVA